MKFDYKPDNYCTNVLVSVPYNTGYATTNQDLVAHMAVTGSKGGRSRTCSLTCGRRGGDLTGTATQVEAQVSREPEPTTPTHKPPSPPQRGRVGDGALGSV